MNKHSGPGDKLEISCSVRGGPIPDVIWTRVDGEAIQDDVEIV